MKYIFYLLLLSACTASQSAPPALVKAEAATFVVTDSIVPPVIGPDGKLIPVQLSDNEWKKQLSEMEYYVLRNEGTERAFTGDLWNNHATGTYICAGCGLPLFYSDTKFESGTGWPSFFKPISPDRIKENRDESHGMLRVEVECARCGGHQGHVFEDGPAPTGLRYCINAVSLNFVPQ
jgi:peptide-methionine (R)-S-oxide reductase